MVEFCPLMLTAHDLWRAASNDREHCSKHRDAPMRLMRAHFRTHSTLWT